jgi:hypothetical protein
MAEHEEEEEDLWQMQRTHRRSATKDCVCRERGEEASAARLSRVVATVAAMHDVVLVAAAAA